MADITNPEAIAFANEQLRPICELARALKARVDEASVRWYGGVNTEFPNDSSPVADGRTAEGISRLTGEDVNNALSVLIGMCGTPYDAEIVEKPCVRPLWV